jgi:hypothetical protein
VRTDAAVRTFPTFIRWTLIIAAVSLGAGYAIGPEVWYSSPSFTVLKGIGWFPVPAWGLLFMVCGFLMGFTKLAGYALGVITWGTWWLALVIAAFEGHLAGWGGCIYPGFMVAICGYEVFRWGQRNLIKIRANSANR